VPDQSLTAKTGNL